MNEYFAKRAGGNGLPLEIVVGVIMLAVVVAGVIVFAVTKVGVVFLEVVGVFVFVGVVETVVGVAKLKPLVAFRADHVEFKKAPLAPRKFLLFRDIEGFRVESPTAAFVVSQGKEIRLPLAWMDEGSRTSLVARFQSEIAKSKGQAA